MVCTVLAYFYFYNTTSLSNFLYFFRFINGRESGTERQSERERGGNSPTYFFRNRKVPFGVIYFLILAREVRRHLYPYNFSRSFILSLFLSLLLTNERLFGVGTFTITLSPAMPIPFFTLWLALLS